MFSQVRSKNLKKFSAFPETLLLSLINKKNPPCICIQKQGYVNMYMKWKKDSYYDSIESIHNSIQLKRIITLKNCITASPDRCIPISEVSKKGVRLEIPMKVAKFLRLYPSIFEEFTGPKYNLPWFRLTPDAANLDEEEQAVYRENRFDLQERLRKFILMSPEKRVPLKIIQGMLWYLGLPNEYWQDPEANLDKSFSIVNVGDGLKGLAVENDDNILSVVQKNAMKRGDYNGGPMEAIEFSLFPSNGLRLRTKISNWLSEFQKLPYVSPYADCSDLIPDSDLAEKRVVALLHELLSLFVEHSAERRKLLCLKKYLGLPQKVHKAFERHPHMFYLSMRNHTCTAILKEPYCEKFSIAPHPLAEVRKKYIQLMNRSSVIFKNRRSRKPSIHRENENPKMGLQLKRPSVLCEGKGMDFVGKASFCSSCLFSYQI